MDILETPGCQSDYLEIRDGHWLKSDLLGTEKLSDYDLYMGQTICFLGGQTDRQAGRQTDNKTLEIDRNVSGL